LAPALAVAQQAPNRTRPPALAAPTRLILPSIEKHELKNGLDVWLVEAHEVPLVQVNLVIHAGSGDDPPGAFGLASLTAAMLDEGAGDRNALQIADQVDFLGAELGTTSSSVCARSASRLCSRRATIRPRSRPPRFRALSSATRTVTGRVPSARRRR